MSVFPPDYWRHFIVHLDLYEQTLTFSCHFLVFSTLLWLCYLFCHHTRLGSIACTRWTQGNSVSSGLIEVAQSCTTYSSGSDSVFAQPAFWHGPLVAPGRNSQPSIFGNFTFILQNFTPIDYIHLNAHGNIVWTGLGLYNQKHFSN